MATPYVVNVCNDIAVSWFQSRRLIFAAGNTHPRVMKPLWHGLNGMVVFFFASAHFVAVAANAQPQARIAFDKPQ